MASTMASTIASLATLAVASADAALSVDAGGTLIVDGKPWFAAGNVSVTVAGMQYSTADGSLARSGDPSTSTGVDKLGHFTATTMSWKAGKTGFTTETRLYGSAFVVYKQTFPDGATGTNASAEVSSCWPSIDPTPAAGQEFGYVSWKGRFLEASAGGAWQGGSKGNPGVGTGGAGGPFVVFENPMKSTLVFSPASNFMTNTPGTPSMLPGDNSFCFGLDGPVTNVPAGYSLETIVMLGTGVNSAMKSFGTTLLNYYGTVRSEDYATKWLGFSTDNGAYYYYNTAPGKFAPGPKETYQQTLLDVHAYAQKENIPYKHVLLDSWWYTKGDASGVKEWDATNSTFPDGLASFAEKTGWKFQMHNRMWSDNNIYAKQNGGGYDFIVDPKATVEPKSLWGTVNPVADGGSGLAIPNDQALWDDLIANKTAHGVPMVVYEQDWMYNEWQGLVETQTSPTLSRQWLIQMGNGALKSNVTVQYCMTYARMVLQTSEIPAVTTFRASDDYGPGQTGYYPHVNNPDGSHGCGFPYCVYYVGTTSILAWAMELRPSKDNYWSTPVQPGSAFNHNKFPSFYNDTIEPYNEMQGAVSSYTTAMVAPSDGVGFSNASLIKMACRSDGFLLQPSAPARAIDASFALSGGPIPHVNNVHPVMATHTLIGSTKWSHVLVIGLNATWSLLPAHLGDDFDNTAATSLVWSGYQPSVGMGPANITVRNEPFSPTNPIILSPCKYADFGLWHIAPVLPLSKAAFLGEVGKWVPVATGRVSAVEDSSSGITVNMTGESGEVIEVAFAVGVKVTTVLCTMSVAGTATAVFDGIKAKC